MWIANSRRGASVVVLASTREDAIKLARKAVNSGPGADIPAQQRAAELSADLEVTMEVLDSNAFVDLGLPG